VAISDGDLLDVRDLSAMASGYASVLSWRPSIPRKSCGG
jgi:hypothetical protein